MTNPTLTASLPPLWLQERGIRDPYTNTLTFTRAYTNAASTDIRETFARAYLQLHIDRQRAYTALMQDQTIGDISLPEGSIVFTSNDL